MNIGILNRILRPQSTTTADLTLRLFSSPNYTSLYGYSRLVCRLSVLSRLSLTLWLVQPVCPLYVLSAKCTRTRETHAMSLGSHAHRTSVPGGQQPARVTRTRVSRVTAAACARRYSPLAQPRHDASACALQTTRAKCHVGHQVHRVALTTSNGESVHWTAKYRNKHQ